VKTQIIQLDPEDDHHSAREKLRWAKAPRIVLIWPGRGRTLFHKLDLVLLQRQSQQLGVQLGLITYDPQVTEIAADLGIPVFESIEAIDQQPWTRPARAPRRVEKSINRKEQLDLFTQARPSREAGILPDWLRIVLFGSTAILLLTVIVASLPSARITLNPPVTVRTNKVQITLDSNTAEAQSDVLPAQPTVVEVSATLRVPTSGAASAPNARASGEVQLTNLSNEVVTLPSGARLRALDRADLTFETTTSAVIPFGEMITVPILALDAGLSGNIEAGMTWALEGELGLVIEVQNPDPTSGGSLATRMAVSASDQAAALRAIQDALLDSAKDEIERSLAPDQMLVPGSLLILRTVASSQDHTAGEIADSLEVARTLEVEGLVIDDATLHRTLEDLFTKDLRPGAALRPTSLSILKLTPSGPRQTNSLQLSVEFQASSYDELDRAALAKRLRGISRDETDLVVQKYEPGFSVLEIQTRPAWLPILPIFEFQIEITLPWEVVR